MTTIDTLPENWVNFTKDDEGLEFAFYWHRFNSDIDDSFHPVFQRAISYISKNP